MLIGSTLVQVNDGSTLSGLQIIVNPECEGYSLIEDGQVATGASVAAVGELTESPGGRQKVRQFKTVRSWSDFIAATEYRMLLQHIAFQGPKEPHGILPGLRYIY